MRKKLQSFFYSKDRLNVFNIALVLIFLLGLMLRIIGTNPGYPQTHPDEPVMYATSINMVINKTLDPFSVPIYKFYYPGLTIYLYAFLFQFIFVPIGFVIRTLSSQSTALTDIAGPGFINAMYWSRYITAVITFLSVPLVYLIGQKMFNKYVGLIAALFIALNYRHVLSGHFSLTDGPNATFALLVLFISLVTYKNPSLKNYLFLGVSVALSLSTKLHFYSILSFLFVHLLIVMQKKNAIQIIKEFFSKKFILASVFVVVFFILLNPYLPLNFLIAKNTIAYYNLRIGLFYPPFEITFPSVWYLYEIGFGKIISILFVAGMFLVMKDRKLWVNGIFLSFFIFVPGILYLYFSHAGAYVRYFASITPFASIVAAYAFYVVFTKVWKRFAKNKTFFLLVLLFLALIASFDQIKNSLVLNYHATRPWNSRCITKWMNENIKENSIVAVNALVPRVDKTGVQYVDFDNVEGHKHIFTLGKLQEEKVDYAVLDIEYLRGRFNWWLSSSRLYWGPPVETLDNSLDGLVLKELSRYIVKTCIKPWESPGNNYIAIKIPKENKPSDLVLLRSHDFTLEKGKIWELSSPFKTEVLEDVRAIRSEDCLNKYCLKVEGRSGVPSREKIVIINNIPVVPGEKYIVKAKVKSYKKVEGENRDGFLRIDYYNSKDADDRKRGITASVSSRYFSDGSWKELSASIVAPKEAKYLQISFQVERYNRTFFIEDVRLYRSEDRVSEEEINASNAKEIKNEILYPLYLL